MESPKERLHPAIQKLRDSFVDATTNGDRYVKSRGVPLLGGRKLRLNNLTASKKVLVIK